MSTVSAAGIKGADAGVSHAWEENSSQNAWDRAVQEDEHGHIVVANGQTLAEQLRARRKRKITHDTAQRNRRIVRDMIRYVYVLIDVSRWMRVKDPVLPPGTRVEAAVQLLKKFCHEYYDQNPLSHLGFCIVQKGEAELLSPLSCSRDAHAAALDSVAGLAASQPQAGGEFSLQNGLELAGRSLGHQPSHGSREIIVITSALSTCDPGNILTDTLPKLKQANVRVSCLALAAELHVCRKISEATNGTMGVLLDRVHFGDWLNAQTVPPPRTSTDPGCDMVLMGFPTRVTTEVPTVIHSSSGQVFGRIAYACPNCQAKHKSLPTPCSVCNLPLVLAPHLSRSFHHLFPVAAFSMCTRPDDKIKAEVSSAPLGSEHASSCFGCLLRFGDDTAVTVCPECSHNFCVDCETYLHENLHNCPGCLGRE